jgi:hypothetical protein
VETNDDKLSEKGTATMKLTTTTQVSVDGVMQGPGGLEENRSGGFERGGWADFDNEAGTVMDEIYQRAGAFLFGRYTYESFAGSWGTWDDPGDSPMRPRRGLVPDNPVCRLDLRRRNYRGHAARQHQCCLCVRAGSDMCLECGCRSGSSGGAGDDSCQKEEQAWVGRTCYALA